MPTKKLQSQLTTTETLTAAVRGPWANISATMNQGIAPANRAKLLNKACLDTDSR